MKTLFQKFLCVVMLAVATLFVACEPEYVQKNEEVDPSGVGFYAPDFNIVVKSKMCSEILLSAGSDGSMTYLDGAKVSELGHWLMLDTDAIGDEGCDKDTLFASFNPPTNALSVTWEIEDPSVLEIVAESVEDGYIVVKAKKIGTTNITASCEGTKTTIQSTVTNYYVTKMEGWDSNAVKVKAGWQTENYTIFKESEDPNSTRKSQTVWMKMDKKPTEAYAPIDWLVSEENIVKLEVKEGVETSDGWTPDTCVILPLTEGKVSITAKCQYRTVEVLVTVLDKHVLTPIDSLQLADNDGNVLQKLWLSRGEEQLTKVSCFPDNAYVDYDGYTWRALTPEVATIGVGSEDNVCNVKGVKKGFAQVEVSLGSGDKLVADTLEVEVCNAITASDFSISGPADVNLNTIDVGGNIQFASKISDVAAEVEFGYANVRWYCSAPAEFMTIDETTGKLSATKATGALSYKVWAEITYQKYPGRVGYEDVTVKIKSNELDCKVVKQERVDVAFTPATVTSTMDEFEMNVPLFEDASGNKLVFLPNTFVGIEGDAYDSGKVTLSGSDGYTLVYTPVSGKEYIFNSGTCSLTISGGQATYTFSNIKAINGGGTGIDVYLTIPASGTLTYTPQ